MARHVKFGLGVAILAAAVSIFYFFDIAGRLQSSDVVESEAAFSEPLPPLFEPTDPPVDVRIFFPASTNDVLLRTRMVTIFDSARPEGRTRQIIDHLITGADDDLLFGRLPEGTRLDQVFISEEGTAYLNFNSMLSDNHPGGVLAEQATVYAIVDSLAYNIPEIDRVKILIGGVERETLAGHCMLMIPLVPDLSVSDISPGDPA